MTITIYQEKWLDLSMETNKSAARKTGVPHI